MTTEEILKKLLHYVAEDMSYVNNELMRLDEGVSVIDRDSVLDLKEFKTTLDNTIKRNKLLGRQQGMININNFILNIKDKL